MNIEELMKYRNETVRKIAGMEELVWINPKEMNYSEYEKNLPVSDEELKDAEERLARFAPFIKKVFPETAETNGIIESPLEPIFSMQKELEKIYETEIPGKLYLKMDSHLPVAGSVKARGGVYEVLKHAEELAMEAGMLSVTDDYSILADEKFKKFFSGYKVQVGSTGNLGLSIGITSAALGFEVIVHMSADAKQWKKDMLRSKGVTVIEYADDYGKAVEEGRKSSDADPKSYFVDDEKSMNLFLGYTVAASRMKKQFDEKGIVIDKEHPLLVYIPCGVGGAPGGVAYGIKRIFKENAYVFFVEPTLAPCMVLGMATELHENICVRDLGIYGLTHADGLAVGRASGLVSKIMDPVLSGIFTLEDYKLYDYLRILNSSENKRIEPSSCAAFEGPVTLMKYETSRKYVEEKIGKNIENAYHICWATGGRMVPQEDMEKFLNTYLK
ncbi:D-serine ammonia-lyase [Fusobacterium sp. SB021]